jgi:hypothetical protein
VEGLDPECACRCCLPRYLISHRPLAFSCARLTSTLEPAGGSPLCRRNYSCLVKTGNGLQRHTGHDYQGKLTSLVSHACSPPGAELSLRWAYAPMLHTSIFPLCICSSFRLPQCQGSCRRRSRSREVHVPGSSLQLAGEKDHDSVPRRLSMERTSLS